MTVLRRTRIATRLLTVLVAFVAAGAVAPDLAAQGGVRRGKPTHITDADGRDTPVRRLSGFQLFGAQDLAFSGLRGVGNLNTAVANVAPCDNGLPPFCHSVGPGAAFFHVFDMSLHAGVPRGDWLKNRDRATSLRGARGNGYSYQRNDLLFTGRMELGPHDGTLGTLFSGATATGDATCQDHSGANNGFVTAGLQLLAGSDCSPTWAGGVFGGDHPIPLDSWVQLFQSQGAAFAFDFHRVPDNLKRLDRTLGSLFSTYGAISDFSGTIRSAYGSVVPGGVGDPTLDGWPLGLVYEFQAYSFSLPTVASAFFWQMLVINRSQDVYTVGLDYDSVYVGLTQGTGFAPQNAAEYFEPQRGALLFGENGVNLNCNNAIIPSGVAGCTQSSARGFAQGASAVIMLKSPIGDLRNKLFSNPASPFYSPGHPLAGDTLTFNHAHFCRFSACSNNTVRFSDKRGFGMISSTEENVLDGRTPGSIPATEYWQTFRGRFFPAQDGKFNVLIPPGNWDYNKDGVLDTLHIDTCGGPAGSAFTTIGCVATWSDTMPGKQNNGGGNIGGTFSVGPFKLAAGDTAAFMIGFVGEVDSIRLESALNSTIEFYNSFFFGPEAPVPTRVVSSEVVAGGDRSTVTLFFTDDPERWQDPFLLDFANKVSLAPPGTELERLNALNPTFVADLQARAADNLEEMQIYKSCDGGNSFTADGDCDGDPAEDDAGNAIGTGWQAFRILRRSDFPNGDIPNVFTDNTVLGGHTYIYSIISKTRGASFTLRDSVDTDGDGAFDDVGGRVFEVAPQLINSLSRSASDPSVASVYVPFSNQAGSAAARMTLTASTGGASVPFTVQFAGTVVPGSYQAVFGTFISITEIHDSVVTDSVVMTIVRVEDRVTALDPTTGGSVTASFDAVEDTSTAPRGVPFAGTPSTTTTVGDTTFYTFSGVLGFVVFKGGGGAPLFASTTLTGAPATPTALFASPDYGGFVISADNRNSATFAGEATIENGDTIPQSRVDNFRVQFLRATATSRSQGDYHVQWTGDPFGVTRGFTLNFQDGQAMSAAVAESLAARNATPARADSAVAALLGVDPSGLRPARLPFTITNTSTGRPATVVAYARLSTSILLGSAEDTVRVAVPGNEWVPGDAIALIEAVEEDSLSGTFVVLGPDGRPLRVLRDRVTFTSVTLGCVQTRDSCNPTRPGTIGAGTGYLALTPATVTTFHYFTGFNRGSAYTFDVAPPVSGTAITTVSQAQLDSVRVVPNPFVAFSTFQTSINEPRVVFTHMPPQGTLRIYTVSGQFVQAVTWTEADLSAGGDLHYNLRTREGTDLATGLYIWVLNTDVGGRRVARGKFVVIRGRGF